ncbi:hypothetical protein IF1G_04092 [Cordyceps javanica]|uniref:Uncharacterized protein n=1 Tax=Cordyceps javanica TaxID=43265 RepID=A0A545V566_9HYPO|nr:hypothetical protein IF1G_04092 [Cordyceps javanica]TQW08114.1 hypothetical protein IF2G_03990 [Cordyceps javanica]
MRGGKKGAWMLVGWLGAEENVVGMKLRRKNGSGEKEKTTERRRRKKERERERKRGNKAKHMGSLHKKGQTYCALCNAVPMQSLVLSNLRGLIGHAA